MTAIDFSSFVDKLTQASGETILPFFRTSLAVENKLARGFDPVTVADRAQFGKVEKAVKLSRYGGDCYAYCMLAAGNIDLVIETEIKPHDIVPLIPIIAGAGGIVTTWEGGPAQNGGRIIAAGDKRTHAAAMEMLKG